MRHRFDDFDALAEAGGTWDLRFRQLDRGSFVGELEKVVAGGVAVSRCHFNRRLHQAGSAPPGCRTFGITLADHAPFRWRRHEVGPGDVMGFREDVEMDCCSEPGFHLFAVSIADDLLAQAAQHRGLGSHEELLRPEQVVRPAAGALARLHRLCRRVSGPETATTGAPGHLRAEMNEELPGLVLDAFSTACRKPPASTAKARRRALRRAREAITGYPDPILSVAELCRLTGEGERTLRYAFTEAYGISPKAFLQARRLNAVRSELARSGPGTVIADVANQQGFWHMGQFARDYRTMFDELPSETLARRHCLSPRFGHSI